MSIPHTVETEIHRRNLRMAADHTRQNLASDMRSLASTLASKAAYLMNPAAWRGRAPLLNCLGEIQSGYCIDAKCGTLMAEYRACEEFDALCPPAEGDDGTVKEAQAEAQRLAKLDLEEQIRTCWQPTTAEAKQIARIARHHTRLKRPRMTLMELLEARLEIPGHPTPWAQRVVAEDAEFWWQHIGSKEQP